MRHRIVPTVWCLMLVMSIIAAGQNPPARGPSTPEERARLVAIARKLEAAPLDQSLVADRKWAVIWLIQVPDITVRVCTDIMGKGYSNTKYKYRSDLFGVLTLSSTAFAIEHPELADNHAAVYIAGAEGMLKAYTAILRDDPHAKWKVLDEALEKQGQGQLTDYVRENSKTCK